MPPLVRLAQLPRSLESAAQSGWMQGTQSACQLRTDPTQVLHACRPLVPFADQPDLFISMPHVMLAGQPVAGAPAGEVEESACAAACRAASQCNIYFWCPAAEGCSTSLTNATGGSLPYRHCELAQQPNALPGQAHPPEAVDKGPAVAVTSGASPAACCFVFKVCLIASELVKQTLIDALVNARSAS